MTIKSYTKYFIPFREYLFFTQKRRLEAQIGYLKRKKLKQKTIKRYLVRLESVCLDYTLDINQLEVYIHLIFLRIIADL